MLFVATKAKEVALMFISTNKMIIDLLTKLVSRDAFEAHTLSIGLCTI